MKKYIYLAIHMCFYIPSLLFLPKNIALMIAVFLVSILILDHLAFAILPLALCFVLPVNHIYILASATIFTMILYPFIKKNRFYALAVFLITILMAFTVLWITEGLSLEVVKIMILLFVIYSLINLLHVFHQQNQKNIIVPYQQKIIDLTMIVSFLCIFMLYAPNQPYLYFFLFMQLYLIKDIKYNVIISAIYATYISITKVVPLSSALLPIAISFLPISVCLGIQYDTFLWIPFILYSIAVQLIHIRDKHITIENNYIDSLFDDFNKYIQNLSNEYDKNNKIKDLKSKRLKDICITYCNQCSKNTLCKTKLDRRYSFLSAAILGSNQNIFNCPYYSQFQLDVDVNHINSSYEYSALQALTFEMNQLYHQSLLMKREYEIMISLLNDYGYEVTSLDMNLASPSLYFSIELAPQKPIIESVLLRCCYKAFGEVLELKIIDHKLYFYKKPKIKISYAHTILAKEGNLLSGDNYYIKKDYNSSYIFALSDGMGSGLNAYQESAEALKTITQLLSYHFRIQTILKLLEDIYELRSNYDRYATLDFLAIDTSNCKMNLYKMGSSTTYVLHNNQLITYENQTLPLKLDEVNSSYELDVYSGDYIFLLSDGISDFISPQEFYSLVQDGNKTADEACYSIIEYIKKKENNNLKDDLSLIVIKAI